MQPTSLAKDGQLAGMISQQLGKAESYEQAAACLLRSLNQPDVGPMLLQAAQGLSNREILTAVRRGSSEALSAADATQLGQTLLRVLVRAACGAEVQAALNLLDRARESQSAATLAESIDSARKTVADLLSSYYYFSRDFVEKKDLRLTVEDFYSSPYKLFSTKLCLDGESRLECSTGQELLDLYHVLQSGRFLLELQRDFDGISRDFAAARASAKTSPVLLGAAATVLAPHLAQLGICLCIGAPSEQHQNELLPTLRTSPRIDAVFSSVVKGAADTCQIRLSCSFANKGRSLEMVELDSIQNTLLPLRKNSLLRYLASGGAELSVSVVDSSIKLPRAILEEVSAVAKTGVLMESFFGRPVEVSFSHVNLHLHLVGLKFLPKK